LDEFNSYILLFSDVIISYLCYINDYNLDISDYL